MSLITKKSEAHPLNRMKNNQQKKKQKHGQKGNWIGY